MGKEAWLASRQSALPSFLGVFCGPTSLSHRSRVPGSLFLLGYDRAHLPFAASWGTAVAYQANCQQWGCGDTRPKTNSLPFCVTVVERALGCVVCGRPCVCIAHVRTRPNFSWGWRRVRTRLLAPKRCNRATDAAANKPINKISGHMRTSRTIR